MNNQVDHDRLAAKMAKRAMTKRLQRAMNLLPKYQGKLSEYQYAMLCAMKAEFSKAGAKPEVLSPEALGVLQGYIKLVDELEALDAQA